MQCSKCRARNKKKVYTCRRCGHPLGEEFFQPSWRWSVKVLGISYLSLIAAYFLLKAIL